MNPELFINTFFLLSSLLETFVSCSKRCRDEIELGNFFPSKHQIKVDESKLPGVDSDHECSDDATTQPVFTCSCRNGSFFDDIASWFGGNANFNDFTCSECENKLKFSDFCTQFSNSLRPEQFETLLLKAFRENNSEIFEMILKSKPGFIMIVIEGKSLLKMAIEQGFQEIFSILIQRTELPNDVVGPIEMDMEIMEKMVKRIIKEDNVNGMRNVLKLKLPFRTLKRNTKFYFLYGSAMKSKELFGLLLTNELKFNDNILDEKLRCYYFAISKDRYENLELIEGVNVNTYYKSGGTLLISAINTENIRMVEKLIKLGANVNLKTENAGKYPLDFAILKNNKKIVLSLLRAGASIEAVDKNGINAIGSALLKGKVESFKAILEFTKIDSLWEFRGQSVLDLATLSCNIELVQYVLDQGFTVSKFPTLVVLIIKNKIEMIEFMLENFGLHLDHVFSLPTSTVQAPIYTAIENDQIQIIELLLKHGLNPNTSILFASSTLLHYAIQKGQVAVSRLLIKYGADTEAVDKDGRTPFSYINDQHILEKIRNMDEFL